MNKINKDDAELESLLKQVFRDDLPAEVEAGMSRRLLDLRRTMGQPAGQASSGARSGREESRLPAAWQWPRWAFRKEVLVFSSVIMMVIGCIAHLGGYQNVLAHSISHVKVILAMSGQLRRATSMDCSMLWPGKEGKPLQYRVRWAQSGRTRVDVAVAGRTEKTFWTADGSATIADYADGSLSTLAGVDQVRDPLLQPVLAFISPAVLARHLEERCQLRQVTQQDTLASALLFVGHEGRDAIEVTVDGKTYLPATFKKPLPDVAPAGRQSVRVMEARFVWNQPVAPELLVPGITAGK
jgi:hypothetical protein